MQRNRIGYDTYARADRSFNDARLREALRQLDRQRKQGCGPETIARTESMIAEQRARCIQIHGSSLY